MEAQTPIRAWQHSVTEDAWHAPKYGLGSAKPAYRNALAGFPGQWNRSGVSRLLLSAKGNGRNDGENTVFPIQVHSYSHYFYYGGLLLLSFGRQDQGSSCANNKKYIKNKQLKNKEIFPLRLYYRSVTDLHRISRFSGHKVTH